jgi:hypothetical protein
MWPDQLSQGREELTNNTSPCQLVNTGKKLTNKAAKKLTLFKKNSKRVNQKLPES